MWEATVTARRKTLECQWCAGRRLTASNRLAALHPEIAQLWRPTRNGDLTPTDVRPNSTKAMFWRCPVCEHEWSMSPRRRALQGTGCPACAGWIATTEYNLAAACPDLAREWHPPATGTSPRPTSPHAAAARRGGGVRPSTSGGTSSYTGSAG